MMSEQEPVQGYYRQEPPKPPKKGAPYYGLDRFLGLLFAVLGVIVGIMICAIGLAGPDGPSPFKGLELVVGIVIIGMSFLYSYASRSRQWAFIVIFALSILGFIVGVSQRTLTFTKWDDYVGMIWLVYSPLRLFRIIGPPLLKAGE
ncbi:MAG: hypothetical protein JST35_10060 [Armatimonadetes bacterium]|nr:hypothetical protein [Armatimonadota bacterium]